MLEFYNAVLVSWKDSLTVCLSLLLSCVHWLYTTLLGFTLLKPNNLSHKSILKMSIIKSISLIPWIFQFPLWHKCPAPFNIQLILFLYVILNSMALTLAAILKYGLTASFNSNKSGTYNDKEESIEKYLHIP